MMVRAFGNLEAFTKRYARFDIAKGPRQKIEKVKSVIALMKQWGFVGGGIHAVRLLPYFGAAYRTNRRIHGRAAAIGIEVAVFSLDRGIKLALKAGGTAVGGLVAGHAGALAGAAVGSVTAKVVNAGLGAAGFGTGGAARASVNKIARRISGISRKEVSDVRARKRQRAVTGAQISHLPLIAKGIAKKYRRAGQPVPAEILLTASMSESEGADGEFEQGGPPWADRKLAFFRNNWFGTVPDSGSLS